MVLPVLIEPVPIIDDFAVGVATISSVGPCARLPFYSEQTLYEANSRRIYVVVRKLILPNEALMPCIKQMLLYLGESAVDENGERLHLVH